MSKRTIALLVLLAVLCGGGYWFYNWTQRGFIIIGDPAWPSIRSSSLTSMTVRTESGVFALVSQNGEWFVADASLRPVVKADNARVEELITTIEEMPPVAHIGRYYRGAGKKYGLDSSNTGITIAGKGVWRLGFGSKGPQENTVYVRSSLQGDQIVLCDGRLEEFIRRPESAYYDLQLVTFAAEDVVKVAAVGPETGTWEVTRSRQGVVFSAPEELVPFQVDNKRISMLIQALASVRGVGFVKKNPVSLPASLMHYRVWEEGEEEPQQVYVYPSTEKEGEYMVRTSRHGNLVALEKDSLEKLAVTSFLLRQRPVFMMDLSEVTRQRLLVRSNSSVREYNAERLHSGWYEKTSSSIITGVDVMLWRLRELQYLAPPQTTQSSTAELSITWQLFGKGQEKPLAVLHFYTDTNLPARQCWLRVLGTEKFYPVDKQLLDDIMSRLPALTESGVL